MAVKQKPGYNATRPIGFRLKVREEKPKGQRIVIVGSIIPAKPNVPKRLRA